MTQVPGTAAFPAVAAMAPGRSSRAFCSLLCSAVRAPSRTDSELDLLAEAFGTVGPSDVRLVTGILVPIVVGDAALEVTMSERGAGAGATPTLAPVPAAQASGGTGRAGLAEDTDLGLTPGPALNGVVPAAFPGWPGVEAWDMPACIGDVASAKMPGVPGCPGVCGGGGLREPCLMIVPLGVKLDGAPAAAAEAKVLDLLGILDMLGCRRTGTAGPEDADAVL